MKREANFRSLTRHAKFAPDHPEDHCLRDNRGRLMVQPESNETMGSLAFSRISAAKRETSRSLALSRSPLRA